MGNSARKERRRRRRAESHVPPPPEPSAPPVRARGASVPAQLAGMSGTAIPDSLQTLDEVHAALVSRGVESSNLIVGIDFTKSNSWTGKLCFGGRDLHDTSTGENPYMRALAVIARTLEQMDDDNLIPVYGFGCARSQDKSVFPLYFGDAPCHGLPAVLEAYKVIAPAVRQAGPTSFGPIIRRAIDIVVQTGQYHILLIIGDGIITESASGKQERDTVNALVEASNYPLSIIMVGVGDGPFDKMDEFDDRVPQRAFDNFQFVNATKIFSKGGSKTAFAVAALQEVPQQYALIDQLGLLDNIRPPNRPPQAMVPPPIDHPSSDPPPYSPSAPPYTPQ